MGNITQKMAAVKLFLVLVVCAYAHQTDTNKVEMLQEDAGVKMKADVVYRISWNTKWDTVPSKTASKDTISITIEGKDGATTGTKVTVTSDGTDSWKPGFLKINMNSAETGLGNGIYYMDIGKKIDSNLPFEVSTDAVDSNGEKIDMTRKSSHKYGIIKCEASACEEEMEKKMAMEMEAVKK